MAPTYADEAVAALDHEDTMANRDHFTNGREEYLARMRERATVYALLDIGAQLARLVELREADFDWRRRPVP